MQWWMWAALGLGCFYVGWLAIRSHKNDDFDPWRDPKSKGPEQPPRKPPARRQPPGK